MCDNVINNFAVVLGSIPDCYKTQKYPSVLNLLQSNLFLIDLELQKV